MGRWARAGAAACEAGGVPLPGAMPGRATPSIVLFGPTDGAGEDAGAGVDWVGAMPGSATPSIVDLALRTGAAGSGACEGAGFAATGDMMPSIVDFLLADGGVGVGAGGVAAAGAGAGTAEAAKPKIVACAARGILTGGASTSVAPLWDPGGLASMRVEEASAELVSEPAGGGADDPRTAPQCVQKRLSPASGWPHLVQVRSGIA
jgi:hypothetical protein